MPSRYRNAASESGHREFIRDREFGASYHAYVLDWGDLDGDVYLDLVTATGCTRILAPGDSAR